MTIFVDQTITITPKSPYVARYGNQWCHLYSDESTDELHAFARKLGLNPRWYQADKLLLCCHYDLTPKWRAKAVNLGAVEVHSLSHRREMARNGTLLKPATPRKEPQT